MLLGWVGLGGVWGLLTWATDTTCWGRLGRPSSLPASLLYDTGRKDTQKRYAMGYQEAWEPESDVRARGAGGVPHAGGRNVIS